ncbi:MAG: hypothetical protein ACK58L_19690 [Planctomycetota bacterium]
MARKTRVLPSYLLHKQSGQARVRIDGRDHLLGEYGSESSRIAYGELIARISGGMPIDPFKPSKRGRRPRNKPSDAGLSVCEFCVAFLKHAETHHVEDGKKTSKVHILKSVIRPWNDLHGLTPVSHRFDKLTASSQHQVDEIEDE